MKYYRITFEPSNNIIDHDFIVGMQRTFTALQGSGQYIPTHGNPTKPGDYAAVVDVRSAYAVQYSTIADMVSYLEGLTYLTRVRSVERIAATSSKPDAREDATQAAENAIDREGSHNFTDAVGDTVDDTADELTALWDSLKALVFVLIIAAIIIAVVYARKKLGA
jgi:hypothetical protein